jgi:oxygen-dependent protoporphyrinogen oxidase
VIRGVLCGSRVGDRAFSPRRRSLFSFRSGLGALPEALSRALAGRLVLGARLDRLEPRPGGTVGLHLDINGQPATMTADKVVLALPAYAAARAVAPFDAPAAAELAAIAHPPIAVVFLGYERAAIGHALDGLGVLTPSIEKRGILGCLFSSTLFAGRAPTGQALLTAYVGGARQPELALLAPEALIDLVRGEMRDLLRARAAPALSRVRYWRHGLPQPGIGQAERMNALRAFEARWPGIFLTGNFIGGVSTGACIEAAMATASRVNEQIAGEDARQPERGREKDRLAGLRARM